MYEPPEIYERVTRTNHGGIWWKRKPHCLHHRHRRRLCHNQPTSLSNCQFKRVYKNTYLHFNVHTKNKNQKVYSPHSAQNTSNFSALVCVRTCVCVLRRHNVVLLPPAPVPFSMRYCALAIRSLQIERKKKRRKMEKKTVSKEKKARASCIFITDHQDFSYLTAQISLLALFHAFAHFFSLSSACSFASLALYYAINNTRQYYA